MLAKLGTHPLDVAKKRFQVAGLQRSTRYGQVGAGQGARWVLRRGARWVLCRRPGGCCAGRLHPRRGTGREAGTNVAGFVGPPPRTQVAGPIVEGTATCRRFGTVDKRAQW